MLAELTTKLNFNQLFKL